MAKYTGRIRLVILDIGGTVCDGPQDLSNLYPNDDGMAVKGPVIVMEDIFKEYKMDVDWTTLRKPMGLFKKDHLRVILQYDDISKQFKKAQGHDWTEDDVEEMFNMFRKNIPGVTTTEDLIRPIDGVKECMDELRAAGILIACDTGYPKEACDAIYKMLADKHGVKFDCVADSEVVEGRPSPFLVYDCMRQTSVYPVEAVVKADDVELGVHEGRNSGAWTVALYASGVHGYERLQKANPDYLIPSVKYLPELIFNQIQHRLMKGELPGENLAYDPTDADIRLGRRMRTEAITEY